MASAYGFDIALDGEGAIFALSGAARRDRRQTFGSLEAELRKDTAYVCVRGPATNLNRPLADVIDAAQTVPEICSPAHCERYRALAPVVAVSDPRMSPSCA